MGTKTYFFLCFLGTFPFESSFQASGLSKRSIDLIAAHGLIGDARLPREVAPNRYYIELQPFIEEGYFKGRVKINITWQEPTNEIVLHADQDLEIANSDVGVVQFGADDETSDSAKASLPRDLKISEIERVPKKSLFKVLLEKSLKRGSQCELDIRFYGKLYNESAEGLFRSSYKDATAGGKVKWYVASYFRPNMARKAFPCFDEPAYKVPIQLNVARLEPMVSLSNMPRDLAQPMVEGSNWYWDRYQQTPPMSTFTLGVAIVDFRTLEPIENTPTEIRVWSRRQFAPALEGVQEKINRSIAILSEFWRMPYPLPKLDCVALPNYQATRPSDSWGLLFYKESELHTKGSWHLSQELAYQWLGSCATPFWWSDAHINNALVRYVTAYTTLKMSDGAETFNNWPMTTLYSIYYEFSKRYPHGKSTAIKQDSTSAKTELVFRMLNYTLGEETFKKALQKFMHDRQFKTFFGDDIWQCLTEQAHHDGKLDGNTTVNKIAASWITKDRLPVLNVTRNYAAKTVTLTQRVYLRERPHDVPDQEKFLWWIPIVLVKETNPDFYNYTPTAWMRKERQIELKDMPDGDHFIIVNPEEIGPFPVNYDVGNWNMLARFLSGNRRTDIPVRTRAKLLHDAWNLAYAGDLGFGTALNMTLFLKCEREHLAWDPVFTMIDHIGRHIDSSEVHKKFQTYVRLLLTPLYEELVDEPDYEDSDDKKELRRSTKVFLCQAGYEPCIKEAQEAFKKWMDSDNPDEGNPVANQYICPVFKWGTKDEWEFGLQRVINFPASRRQNERTYLLKTLSGCPVDQWKIERLLNITVLEENGNFTDGDVSLIFSMLTGGANGYTTLFRFLQKNWDVIKVRFENKPHLWNSLVTSATTVFKTQEGLDLVSELYVERQGDFGTAEFVIERALKNIKEETKWSIDNLPVIEAWLDDYLKDNNASIK